MKERIKIIGLGLLLMMMSGSMAAQEQDIVISNFRCVISDLIGSTRPVYDNTGEGCAVLVFNVRDTTFVIEGNLGVLKRESEVGTIRLWVPKGTKRLTVKHDGLFTLRGYQIPLAIESKMAYHAFLWATSSSKERGGIKKPKVKKNIHFYIGAGFQALSLLGPSLAIGVDIDHHIVEVGGIYGLGKTDNLYMYRGENLVAGYKYQAIRSYLRYGYDIMVAKEQLGIMPQAGVALNVMNGDAASGLSISTKDFKRASSVSATLAVRVTARLGNHVGLHVTPEYSMGLYKSNNCKLLSDNDSGFKKWTDGFGVNAGLTVYF
jgi:hypothetical protein